MGAVRRQLSVDFAQTLQQDKKRHVMCFLETVVEFAGALAAAVGIETFAPVSEGEERLRLVWGPTLSSSLAKL